MSDSGIKSFVLLILSGQKTIWKYKYHIILCGILFSALGYFYSQREQTIYTAHSSFFFEASDQITSTNRRVRRRQKILQASRFIESARSRNLIVEILLDSVSIDAKSDYLGNHIIEIYDFRKNWNKPNKNGSKLLNDFYFTTSNIDSFSLAENRVISLLQRRLYRGNQSKVQGMLELKYDPNSDLYTLTTKTKDKELSTALISKVVEHLTKYNDDQWISQSQEQYELLTTERDSTYLVLQSLEERRAQMQDRSRGLTASYPRQDLREVHRQIKFVQDSYNTLTTQIQQAKSTLPLTGQSTITVIDQPFDPHKSGPNILRASLLGGFLGLVLGSVSTLFYKAVSDALAS